MTMEKKNNVWAALPVLFGFFVMGFCDIVGISSDYAASAFGWSQTMAGIIPFIVQFNMLDGGKWLKEPLRCRVGVVRRDGAENLAR